MEAEQNQPKPEPVRDIYRESAEQEIARRQRMEKGRVETIERLKTDPQIQQYLQNFNEYAVTQFIKGYASRLQNVLEYGPAYIDIAEKQTTEYMHRAEVCLAEIQMKKLFDIRCQWGANLISIEGIRTAVDFVCVSYDLMNSPVVPPITLEEFDLYYEYAKSPSFTYNEYAVDWYHLVNDWANQEEPNLPEWFIYHNIHTGANKYMQLPDLRGKKETEYRRDIADGKALEREAKYVTGEVERPVPDTRPFISDCIYQDVLEFMEHFETPETIRMFEAVNEYGGANMANYDDDEDDDSGWLNEEVETIVAKLRSLKNVVLHVKENMDWRRALIESWTEYETQQLIEQLPAAYENYKFMVSSNIAFPKKEHNFYELADRIYNDILDARELNGEPRDLNFDFD